MSNDKKRVLIIDDDHALTQALSIKLESEGLEVDVAYSGEEGLQHIETFKPNLVLLDILMPKMSGVDLLEKYKTIAPNHALKFIILTNDSNTETLGDVFTIEATDFVSKVETPIENVVALVKSRLGM